MKHVSIREYRIRRACWLCMAVCLLLVGGQWLGYRAGIETVREEAGPLLWDQLGREKAGEMLVTRLQEIYRECVKRNGPPPPGAMATRYRIRGSKGQLLGYEYVWVKPEERTRDETKQTTPASLPRRG